MKKSILISVIAIGSVAAMEDCGCPLDTADQVAKAVSANLKKVYPQLESAEEDNGSYKKPKTTTNYQGMRRSPERPRKADESDEMDNKRKHECVSRFPSLEPIEEE